jgi:hypothetical protein
MLEFSTPRPDEEWDAYQQGVDAYDRSVSRDNNPHNCVTAPVLHARWDAGWAARADELGDHTYTDRDRL